MSYITRIALLASVLLLGGCAAMSPDYRVNVDALAAPDALNYKKYFLAASSLNNEGLEFDIYAGQVEQALTLKGLARVDHPSKADAIVLLSYVVGQAQQHTRTTTIPQWGQTGYSSAQTYGSFFGNSYTANTHYTPTYGITGYTPITNTITSYPMDVYMFAKTVKGFGTPSVKELWQIHMQAQAKAPDMRKAFPIMLYAAQPYLVGDSGGVQMVEIPQTEFQN